MSVFLELTKEQEKESAALFEEWYAKLREGGIAPVVANSACMNVAFAISRAIGLSGGDRLNFPAHFAGMIYGWLLTLAPEQREQFWDRIDEIDEEFEAVDELAN